MQRVYEKGLVQFCEKASGDQDDAGEFMLASIMLKSTSSEDEDGIFKIPCLQGLRGGLSG